VTTTLSAKGQIIIPLQVRTQQGLRVGDRFSVLSSGTGEILLKRLRDPSRKSLVGSLRALQGLELRRRDEWLRDIDL